MIDVAAAAREVMALIEETRSMGKPVVVVGVEEARRAVLTAVADTADTSVVSLGSELAAILLAASTPRTDVAAAVARMSPESAPLLLDRIQILMLPQLNIDVIDTLTRVARRHPLAVSWPGRLENGRLRYANHDHPECLDVDATRVIVHDLSFNEGITA